jgi:hypothetical protein
VSAVNGRRRASWSSMKDSTCSRAIWSRLRGYPPLAREGNEQLGRFPAAADGLGALVAATKTPRPARDELLDLAQLKQVSVRCAVAFRLDLG